MAIVSKQVSVGGQSSTGELRDLPGNIPINKDAYCWRIADVNWGPSKSSGKNQFTFDCEIYHPATIKSVVDGKEYNVAGKKAKLYFATTDEAIGYLVGFDDKPGFMEVIGLKPEIDNENPDQEQFKSKCFRATALPEDRVQRKDLTPEQREAGQKVGDPITNEDGSVDKYYAISIDKYSIKPTKVAPPASPF